MAAQNPVIVPKIYRVKYRSLGGEASHQESYRERALVFGAHIHRIASRIFDPTSAAITVSSLA